MTKQPAPDISDVVKEARRAFGSLAKDFQASWQKAFDDAEYRFDKELGKQIAKHPELYAELKRGYKKLRRGTDKLAKDLGLK